MTRSIYLIGSLRNPKIPQVGVILREAGYDIFDDWFAGGPIADDSWKAYEVERGHSYRQALENYAACHVFEFDWHHLTRCDVGVLIAPAGRSGHMELGYMIGSHKPGFILLEEEPDPDRWDVMYKFATGIAYNIEELQEMLR